MTSGILQGRKLYALIISIAAAALCYLTFSFWAGWRDVLAAFGLMGASGMSIVLALSLVNYSLRFVRWQLYLHALGHPTATVPSALIYIAGFALTTTPGKAGEMLRGVFLKARGMPYSQSTAAFLSDRLSDLVAIILLTLQGITLYPQGRNIVLAGIAAVAIGLLLLSQKNWLMILADHASKYTGRVATGIHHFLLSLVEAYCCHTPKLLLSATLLSLLAWSAEAYGFYLILHWMGTEFGISFSFFVYAISGLAGAISFLPGGLGGAETVMVGLLIWAGMPGAEAVAATIIVRLATLWFAVALGALALLFGGQILKGDEGHNK